MSRFMTHAFDRFVPCHDRPRIIGFYTTQQIQKQRSVHLFVPHLFVSLLCAATDKKMGDKKIEKKADQNLTPVA